MGMVSAARRFVTAGRPIVPRTISGSAQGFATVSSPRPLSFRMDGLMAKCTIAAIIHFAPLDIVILGGLLAYMHKQATSTAPKAVQADAQAAMDDFKSKKGLDKVNVSKGRG